MKLVVFIILLLDITFFCTESRAQVTVIQSTPIVDWGDWGRAQYCASGHFAVGFRSKMHEYCGEDCDDTSMNGIELLCSDGKRISSLVGPWGTWAANFSECQPHRRLDGFGIKIQKTVGVTNDDTATNGIRMRCSDRNQTILYSSEGKFGRWVHLDIENTSWKYCPPGNFIFGLRTQIDQSVNDATGLVNVMFYCRRP
jgi:hypothetical protein